MLQGFDPVSYTHLDVYKRQVSKRAARDGRNPQTGKTIKIAAKNVVKFKAGADLEGSVNK